MKFTKTITSILTVATLIGCTNRTNVISDPSDREQVAAQIQVVKDDFNGSSILQGPVIQTENNGLLHIDKTHVNLIRSNGKTFLKVYTQHSSKGWKFIETVETPDGIKTPLVELRREISLCGTSVGCIHEELGFAPVGDLSPNNDLRVRINAQRWGSSIVTIPTAYISAFNSSIKKLE